MLCSAARAAVCVWGGGGGDGGLCGGRVVGVVLLCVVLCFRVSPVGVLGWWSSSFSSLEVAVCLPPWFQTPGSPGHEETKGAQDTKATPVDRTGQSGARRVCSMFFF